MLVEVARNQPFFIAAGFVQTALEELSRLLAFTLRQQQADQPLAAPRRFAGGKQIESCLAMPGTFGLATEFVSQLVA